MFDKFFKNGPSVLIVDDDAATRALLRVRLMKKDGYQVYEAENGEDALKEASSKEPEVIVLDWKMPDISGLDVLRELRNRPETEKTPVLMLTSKNLVSDVELAFEMGAFEYLSKPLDLNLISRKIRAYMDKEQKAV